MIKCITFTSYKNTDGESTRKVAVAFDSKYCLKREPQGGQTEGDYMGKAKWFVVPYLLILLLSLAACGPRTLAPEEEIREEIRRD